MPAVTVEATAIRVMLSIGILDSVD